MAEKVSQESRYESKYGGNFVTPAQFIAEIMCERIAKKNGKTLPVKFWNLPTWKKAFMQQILAANNILKLYSPKAILSALRKTPKIYSLRASWFDSIMQEEEAKVEALNNITEEEVRIPSVQINTSEKPREAFTTNKSTLKKLRDLDG